jgi:hypothetical protein
LRIITTGVALSDRKTCALGLLLGLMIHHQQQVVLVVQYLCNNFWCIHCFVTSYRRFAVCAGWCKHPVCHRLILFDCRICWLPHISRWLAFMWRHFLHSSWAAVTLQRPGTSSLQICCRHCFIRTSYNDMGSFSPRGLVANLNRKRYLPEGRIFQPHIS